MLAAIISSYLESHKRLVVPQLGAFIVKAPGAVLFSELLKRDDGVLRGELRAAGLNELEAAGEIDRFVFEVRHAVSRGEEYRAEGLGVLKPGPNDTIVFEYRPLPDSSASAVDTGATAGPQPQRMPTAAAAHLPHQQPEAPEQNATALRTAVPAEETPERPRTAAEPAISRSATMHPDPSVRGLRYGRPQKGTAACTYAGRPRRRSADRFIWIALLAIALAAAAIAFGVWREAQREREPIETSEPALDRSDGAALTSGIGFRTNGTDPSPDTAAGDSGQTPEHP